MELGTVGFRSKVGCLPLGRREERAGRAVAVAVYGYGPVWSHIYDGVSIAVGTCTGDNTRHGTVMDSLFVAVMTAVVMTLENRQNTPRTNQYLLNGGSIGYI